MRKFKYSMEQMRQALACLNSLSISGIENAKKVCMMESILQNPIEVEGENENGSGECS